MVLGKWYFLHQIYINIQEETLYFYSYIQRNTGQASGKPKLDLNVEEAWAMGFTGKNITTAIMDDGVDYTHPDLMNNFVNLILYSKKKFLECVQNSY